MTKMKLERRHQSCRNPDRYTGKRTPSKRGTRQAELPDRGVQRGSPLEQTSVLPVRQTIHQWKGVQSKTIVDLTGFS